MAVRLAYLGVVLVWTTTPLAIKWSTEGQSFVLAVTARMSIGAVLLVLALLAMRRRLAFNSAARWTYLAVTVQLYLSMIITYWAAPFIPSGWISVIFGLNPFITAFLAAGLLKEQSLGWGKVFAYLLGFAGLLVMFMSAQDLNRPAMLGVAAILISTAFQALSAVWVKRIDARLPAMQQITGGLLFSLPLFYLSWYLIDKGQIPAEIPERTLYAVIYLGVIATTLGFTFYYYILTHLPATNVALLNLYTPALSLLLGYSINHEPLNLKIGIGTALILTALVIYHFAERRRAMAVGVELSEAHRSR